MYDAHQPLYGVPLSGDAFTGEELADTTAPMPAPTRAAPSASEPLPAPDRPSGSDLEGFLRAAGLGGGGAGLCRGERDLSRSGSPPRPNELVEIALGCCPVDSS